jgi:uncharacterized protein (DUF1778 family)
MKHQRIHLRIEPAVKTHLERAAKQLNQSLSLFVAMASIEKAEAMRKNGWRVKEAPAVGDARMKKKAA